MSDQNNNGNNHGWLVGVFAAIASMFAALLAIPFAGPIILGILIIFVASFLGVGIYEFSQLQASGYMSAIILAVVATAAVYVLYRSKALNDKTKNYIWLLIPGAALFGWLFDNEQSTYSITPMALGGEGGGTFSPTNIVFAVVIIAAIAVAWALIAKKNPKTSKKSKPKKHHH